jgi:predicted PurR-regulated permease PerM
MKTQESQGEPSGHLPPSESSANIWEGLTTGALIKFLLLFACGWAIIQLLSYFELLVVIFVTSTILAFLFNHPVSWLSRWLPRSVAVVGLFVVGLAIAGGLFFTLGMTVISQGQQLVESVQDFTSSLTPVLQEIEALLQEWNLSVDLESLEPQLQDQAMTVLTTSLGLLQATLANVVLAILIAVVTLFMLLDGAQIWWWLLDNLPIRHKERFNTLIQRNLLGFFWGRLLLSIFFGVSAFVVFWLLDVPFPLVLAAIAGVLI